MRKKAQPLPVQSRLAVEELPIDRVREYEQNSRMHTVEQIELIAKSITEYGWTNPILIDANDEIIAGHARLQAARTLGYAAVPCIRLGHLSPVQKRALVIADNKIAITGTQWDYTLLKLELSELQLEGFDLGLTGFDGTELDKLFPERRAGLTDEDDVPDPPKDPVTELGDTWLLGPHRLHCGDSASPTAVAKALNGRAADLIVTSPPYNQKIDGFKPSGMHKEHGWVRKVGRLAYADSLPEREYQDQQRDQLATWFTIMRDGASVFYNHKHRYRDKRVVSPIEWLPGPFAFRQEIIWRRPGSVTQNARMFLPSDERIYWIYKGDDFTFNDTTEIKTWSSVWDIPPKANLDHAVAFPVELPERCIRAASMPDDLVFDPYLGSGTTMIAAEKTGRRCVGAEISPACADVAILRWERFTGQTAALEGDGRSFAEIANARAKVPA